MSPTARARRPSRARAADETLIAAVDRVLAALGSGKPATDADVKTLEAKLSEKIEVSARQVLDATNAFTAALASIARGASLSEEDRSAPPRAVRHRLPEERASLTHKFGIAGHEGYITVGLYPNGQPGEIFIKMAKEGSTVSGLMDSFATAVSLSLQHGVPLKVLCEKFAHSRFEPSGWTGNEQIGYAKSIMDYIFRWLQLRFLSGQQLSLFAGLAAPAASPELASGDEPTRFSADQHSSTRGMGATHAPQGGILPEIHATGLRILVSPPHRGPRRLPRCRRDEGPLRHGRCSKLPHLRSHHGPQRKLLPLHELRLNQRLLLARADAASPPARRRRKNQKPGFVPGFFAPWLVPRP